MLDQITRLGSYTTLWRGYVRWKDRTPPFDTHPPVEFRALSEATFEDLVAHYYPQLELVSVERRPTT